MANKKTYYYVLVFAGDGPAYVTGEGNGNMAYWDKSKKPMSFNKGYAEAMAVGISWNCANAVVVASNIELERQPYYYEMGSFKWEDKA